MTFGELEDALARIKAIANEDEQRDAVFALEDLLAIHALARYTHRPMVNAAPCGSVHLEERQDAR